MADAHERSPVPTLSPSQVAALLGAVRAARGWVTVSAPADRFVRLGALRWAARKRRAVDHRQPLYGFFAALRASATGEAPSPAAQQAWARVASEGLSVGRKALGWRGRAVAGRRFAAPLRELWPEVLAPWEVEAAGPWLAALAATVVRPSREGVALVGAGYQERDAGREVVLRRGVYRYVVRPAGALTLGQVLATPGDLARAAIVAVHRPQLLAPALWQATLGRRSAREPIRAALASLALAVRAAASARALGLQRAPYQPDALIAACGAAAAGALEQLAALLWPEPAAPATGSAFESRVLALDGVARPTAAERARRFPIPSALDGGLA